MGFQDECGKVPVLESMLTELRVSATIVIGGEKKLELTNPILYAGPFRIDKSTIDKLKKNEVVHLKLNPTSINDVLEIFKKMCKFVGAGDVTDEIYSFQNELNKIPALEWLLIDVKFGATVAIGGKKKTGT